MPNDLNKNLLNNNAYLTTNDHTPVSRRGANNGASATMTTALTWTMSGLALAACQHVPFLAISNSSSGTSNQPVPVPANGMTDPFMIPITTTPGGVAAADLSVTPVATSVPTSQSMPPVRPSLPTSNTIDPDDTAPVRVTGTYGTFEVTRNEVGEFEATYTVTATDTTHPELGPRDTVYDQLAFYTGDTNDPTVAGYRSVEVSSRFENEAPVITATGSATIVENVSGADLTGTISITARDQDVFGELTFTVRTGETGPGALSDSRANQLFQVVPVSGNNYALKLREGQSLDYEMKTSYSLQIMVDDNHRADNSTAVSSAITVTVIDVDETVPNAAPVITLNSDTEGTIAENVDGGTVTGLSFRVTDAETDTLTFTLESETTDLTSARLNQDFMVVNVGGTNYGLTLKTGRSLDYENLFEANVATTLSMRIVVSDGNGNTVRSDAPVTVVVSNDTADDVPSNAAPDINFVTGMDTGSIDEHVLGGAVTGLRFTVTDEDGDTPTLTLVSPVSNPTTAQLNAAFEIVEVNGMAGTYEIKLRSDQYLDAEDPFGTKATSNISMMIMADDGKGGTDMSGSFGVTLNNVDEAAVNTDSADLRVGIQGTGDLSAPMVGDVLELRIDTADPDGNGTLPAGATFFWYRVGAAGERIGNESTYTVSQSDVAASAQIKLRVDYIDARGIPESVHTENETGAATTQAAGDVLHIRARSTNHATGELTINEGVELTNPIDSDNLALGTGYHVGDVQDAAGSTTFTITGGADASNFIINKRGGVNELYIKSSANVDYETATSKTFVLNIEGTGPSGMKTYTGYVINLGNVDDNAASVTIARTTGGPGAHAADDVYTATVTPDADNGGAETTYEYEWFVGGTKDMTRSGVGDMYSTFTLKATDVDEMLKVDVTYADLGEGTDAETNSDTVSSPVVTLMGNDDLVKEVAALNAGTNNRHAQVGETTDLVSVATISSATVESDTRGTATRSGDDYVYTLSGDDSEMFRFSQSGADMRVVSRAGFDFDDPTDKGDSPKDNTYEVTVTTSVTASGSSTPTETVENYFLTIVDVTVNDPQGGSGPDPFLGKTPLLTSRFDEDVYTETPDDNTTLHSKTFINETDELHILFSFTGYTFIRPGHIKDSDGFSYTIGGVDSHVVQFVESTVSDDIYLVTKVGFDYEMPTDKNVVNNKYVYEISKGTESSASLNPLSLGDFMSIARHSVEIMDLTGDDDPQMNHPDMI